MTKTHAIVHSRPGPLTVPSETNNTITTSNSNRHASSSIWMHLIVMAASASAIGATVVIAVHKFSPIEPQNNVTISNNKTTHMARILNTPDTVVIHPFDPLNCNTTTDAAAILAREHIICGQPRSSIFLIKYSNTTFLENRQSYDLKQIEFQPQISFSNNEFKRLPPNEIQQTYIIMLLDVDDSTNSPIQYWISTINEKTHNHKDICSYKTPNIYTPPHRYAFLLYTTSLKNLELSNNLCNQPNKFPLNKIINDNQLKLLASIYFLSQKHLIPSFFDEK